jgi:hypothetical protein
MDTLPARGCNSNIDYPYHFALTDMQDSSEPTSVRVSDHAEQDLSSRAEVMPRLGPRMRKETPDEQL